MIKKFLEKIRRLGPFIVVAAILVSLFLVVYPFAPLFEYYLRSHFISGNYQIGELIKYISDSSDKPQDFSDLGNRLVIPKIGVDMNIIGGESESYALSSGAWHLPGTSTPDKGDNMALSAHRFKYLPPHKETFYLLDKLESGDFINVYWEGKEYIYKVVSSQIVSPYAVEVLDATEKPTLTLITCNPLFSTKERLVVKAEMASTFVKVGN